MSGFKPVNYADGQVLFEPGDAAHSFYVIQSGQVAIIDRQSQRQLAVLATGESFGEQALVHRHGVDIEVPRLDPAHEGVGKHGGRVVATFGQAHQAGE